MKNRVLFALLLLGALKSNAAAGLDMTYNGQGVQALAYNGVVLEDLGRYPPDAFHIGHMKATDLQGNILPGRSVQLGRIDLQQELEPDHPCLDLQLSVGQHYGELFAKR